MSARLFVSHITSTEAEECRTPPTCITSSPCTFLPLWSCKTWLLPFHSIKDFTAVSISFQARRILISPLLSSSLPSFSGASSLILFPYFLNTQRGVSKPIKLIYHHHRLHPSSFPSSLPCQQGRKWVEEGSKRWGFRRAKDDGSGKMVGRGGGKQRSTNDIHITTQ